MHRTRLRTLVALVLLLAAPLSRQASAELLTFEEFGIAPGEFVDMEPLLTTGDFEFVVGPNFISFMDLLVGSLTFWPHNGSSILVTHGDTIMTRADDGLFSLLSVDVAGFPVNLEDPLHVIGTYADDSTVLEVLIFDGIADGPGGAVDFQTFELPMSFDGLKSVNFLLNGTGAGNLDGLFGIDNIEVPEPPGSVLSLSALFILWILAQRRTYAPNTPKEALLRFAETAPEPS